MTVRNLDALLRPGSVALIGASRQAGSVGAVVARNLLSAGFAGPVWFVNPEGGEIDGIPAFATLGHLPSAPDLAVVCTPPATVPSVIAELGARGTRAAIVISAGFAEVGEAGRSLQQQVLDAAKPHLLRILGPNCVGALAPGVGLNASLAHLLPGRGNLAFVAQSGAVLGAVLDWAATRGIGFSHLISLGDMADIDAGDLLDYLALAPEVRGVLLYLEAVTQARKFMSAARHAARLKPVVVVKAGRHEAAAKAASGHTGALAGSDAAYDAAFRRAGVLRVLGIEELFEAVETLATGIRITGNRLAIVTNGGGLGVLATDTLIDAGGRLAELSPETVARLSAALPPTWPRGNPVDIVGDAPAERYADAMEAVLAEKNADAILVINAPSAVADSFGAAEAVVKSAAGARRPILTSWVGERAATESRALFQQQRIPTFETPGDAVRAFMHLADYHLNQQQLMQVVPSVPEAETRAAEARAVVDRALDAGPGWMSEPDAKAVLAAYGIPVLPTSLATTPAEAGVAAERIGLPAVLKILSPDLTHKSDVGGVVLDIPSAAATVAAAEDMLTKIRRLEPVARIAGFIVQKMIRRPGASELIVGMSEDPIFGPVILFGEGGLAVDVIQDIAVALPPLNLNLALELIGRTRVARRLTGFRSHPAASIEAIAHTLIKLSNLVVDLPEILDLDINPLLADATGVLAVDARIRLGAPKLPGTWRLAIRPYPRQLERRLELADGAYLCRPIRPEDEPLLHDLFARTAPEDIRLRFFGPLKALSHQMAARLTQIDYDREMALVAVEGSREHPAIAGVVRIAADPDNVRAEYAILVRSDLKGHGLGWALMQEIIAYGRSRGLREIFGEVLTENTQMLRMATQLGFTVRAHPEDAGLVTVAIDLIRAGQPAGA